MARVVSAAGERMSDVEQSAEKDALVNLLARVDAENAIAEFLLEQIAADEAVARAATPGPWVATGGCVDGARHQPVVMGGFDSAGSLADGCMDEDARHIARHDPAHVLAVCEAHRRIVEAAAGWSDLCPPDDWPDSGGIESAVSADLGRWLLRALAAIYADRDGFREEWR